MISKIQKWGNSLAIRIPKVFAKTVKIEQGDFIKIKIKNKKIIISKKKKQTSEQKTDLQT